LLRLCRFENSVAIKKPLINISGLMPLWFTPLVL
jgi:hypothetical protein